MVEGRGGRRTGKKDGDGDDKRQGVPAQPWPGLQRQYTIAPILGNRPPSGFHKALQKTG